MHLIFMQNISLGCSFMTSCYCDLTGSSLFEKHGITKEVVEI